MAIQTRIIDVLRKPVKCPVCGGEVVDIIYGTGYMEEWAVTTFLAGLLSGLVSPDADASVK